jgi:hypothetical protein
MSFNSLGDAFKKQQKKFKANQQRNFKKAGLMAVRHFRESFRNEGFTDNGLEKWTEVNRRKPETKAYKYAKPAARTRGILRGKGILANSVKVISTSPTQIVVGVQGLKYAARHNDGLDGMPKRQFIGNSKVLEQKIDKLMLQAWGQS